MNNTLRVGIVGANAHRAWAHDAHIPALKRLPEFQLVAVSARTQELADEAASAFGVPRAFGDSLALVRDPDIDIVSVTVKVPEHRNVVLAALAAGKHVYCEWPLGRDLAEARELAAAVTPGSHVMIGLQALSSPAVRHATTLIHQGTLGDLKVLRVHSPTVGWGPESPQFYAYLEDKQNGATLEAIGGGHTLAVIEAIVGSYVEVDARNSRLIQRTRIMGTGELVERTCADHMFVLGKHQSGAVSALEVIGGTRQPFRLELIGEKGSLRITDRGLDGGFQASPLTLETSFPSEPQPEAAVGDNTGPKVNVGECYVRLAADIRAGTRTVPDFNDAVRLHRLLDHIETASVSGQRQRVVT